MSKDHTGEAAEDPENSENGGAHHPSRCRWSPVSCNCSLLNTDVPEWMEVYSVQDIIKELSKGGDEFHLEEKFIGVLPQHIQFRKVTHQVLQKDNCDEKLLMQNDLTNLNSINYG